LANKILLLIADDEPMIVMAVSQALEDGGYQVLDASTGAQASALLTERHQEICGLITDIRFGSEPDGWEVARQARSLNADIPILYMTGDSAHQWAQMGVPRSAVLQKPFAGAQIVTAISTLLTEHDQASKAAVE
jgi:CheY-like chemotaxis protein